MAKNFFLTLIAFFLSIPSAWAQEVTLASLIESALKNNPQILAAHFRYEAAKSKVKLLRTLEDPRFEYEYDKITADMDAVMNGKTSPMRTFAVSQELPFPTKLILRKKAAEKEAESLNEDYKEIERRVIQDVKNAFSRIFLARKKRAITKENMHLLEQVIEISKTKYSVGKARQQDVLRAQVEYSKLLNQNVLLEQEENIASTLLNSLLNKDRHEALGDVKEEKSKDLVLDEQKILEIMKESRPEILSFEAMVKKTEIDYSLAEADYLPDFMFKYKREEKNGSAGSWAGMFGMTFPLWFWEKQNSQVKEAKANVDMMKAQYAAMVNNAVFEVKSAYYRFETAKKLVKIYETGVLPQARAALETARKGYESEEIDFLDMLDSLRSLREFEIEYFESLANLDIALADLERSVGADLTGKN